MLRDPRLRHNPRQKPQTMAPRNQPHPQLHHRHPSRLQNKIRSDKGIVGDNEHCGEEPKGLESAVEGEIRAEDVHEEH